MYQTSTLQYLTNSNNTNGTLILLFSLDFHEYFFELLYLHVCLDHSSSADIATQKKRVHET